MWRFIAKRAARNRFCRKSSAMPSPNTVNTLECSFRVFLKPKELRFFLDQLLAVSGFVRGDDFVGQFAGNVVVVRILHGIAGATLGLRREVGRIGKHLGKW